MTFAIPLLAALIAATYLLSPFILWRSFFTVLKATLKSREITRRERLALLGYMLKELFYLPPTVLLWWIDDLIFRGYRTTKVPPPLFIISQPRSGTTFLLRTLAKDERVFFTLKHLDWRVSSILAWWIIDRLGLRRWCEAINYWPNTEFGRLASKMHAHTMGSIEGHGVFFEERMFHHYFTFRRFPFPEVMRRMEIGGELSPREKKKLVRGLKRAVQKYVYYHGETRRWLTKENENVEIYRLVYEAFPDAHFLAILRDPQDFARSYISASDASIRAKHGIEIDNIAGWYEANMAFRRRQCDQQIVFCRDLERAGAISYVTYREFTSDIIGTLEHVYKEIGEEIGPEYRQILEDLQVAQDTRIAGYKNASERIEGFDDYGAFVEGTGERLATLIAPGENVITEQMIAPSAPRGKRPYEQ